MLKPLNRDHRNLETLQLFRRVMGSESHLGNAEIIDSFVTQIGDALKAVAATRTRVRGIRAQAQFAQLVVALDACQLMLTVDAGDIYADGYLSSGDFLLV